MVAGVMAVSCDARQLPYNKQLQCNMYLLRHGMRPAGSTKGTMSSKCRRGATHPENTGHEMYTQLFSQASKFKEVVEIEHMQLSCMLMMQCIITPTKTATTLA